MAIAPESGATLWATAAEFANGLDVPQSATYHVWVWAKDDASAEVSLGSQKVAGGTPGNGKGQYAWRRIGEAPLETGHIAVTPGAGMAGIALSTDPAFDAATAARFRFVSDEPVAVRDARAEAARNTDTCVTFPHFESQAEWEAHAIQIHRRMLLGSGLMPLPERAPLNAKITEVARHDDYIVEKVSFEARPGFLVTGNIYRPVGEGPFPALLNPHGHWDKGRLEDGERGSVPARCITFARMGIVSFSYDMIGYNDSLQFKHGWGGPKEMLWGIHPFAFQLWSSVRGVDFLESLSYVDKNRIGCVGASGGGTQTFALYTVDSRIKIAAPVNMISCSMQGGCPCENAPLIRLDGVSNMDIGAMMAPRPLLMVAATGDWTVETPRVEFPAVRSVYALYGARDNVESEQFDYEHNFNLDSRQAVYRFMGKRFLNQPEKYAAFTEPAYQLEPFDALRVFSDGNLPAGLPSKDEIIAQTVESSRAKWEAILPADKTGCDNFLRKYGTVFEDVIDVFVPEANDLVVKRIKRGMDRHEGYVTERLVIGRKSVGDAVPAVFYRPDDAELRTSVVVVNDRGKAAMAEPSGGPGPLVRELLDKGRAVLVIDVFGQGEHNSPLAAAAPRDTGRFPDTFEPTDTGRRVQDVLTALAYCRSRRDTTGRTHLVGLGDAGVWCLFASAVDDKAVRIFVDANAFANESDEAWVEKHYIPCIRSVGDLSTAATFIAARGGALSIANTSDAFKTAGIERAFKAAENKELAINPAAAAPADIVAWIGGA
jgi:dienelactone hydrolase